MKKKIFLFFFGFFIASSAIFSDVPSLTLTTYYNYDTNELKKIKDLSSIIEISIKDLNRWDEVVYRLFKKDSLPEGGNFRLYAYLYTAQRDFAVLSYQIRQKFQGSLDPLSSKIIQLFYPKAEMRVPIKTDAYSEIVTAIVFDKFKARFNEEQKKLGKNESRLLDISYWSGIRGEFGHEIRFWKPWEIPSFGMKNFVSPPDFNKQKWNEQLNRVKQAQEEKNEDIRKNIAYWSKMAGPETGDWLSIATEYMEHLPKFPLGDFILIRSLLSMAIVDTLIATFEAKYLYNISPPYVYDHTLKGVRLKPHHPSYPSAHAAVAATASALLSYFFPENKVHWDELAQEAGNSMVYEGMNYPMDTQGGEEVGERVHQFYIQ